MFRIAALCVAAWVTLFLPMAFAQVAAPSFSPGTARVVRLDIFGFNSATFTPDNPASLMWGAPTRLGLGAVQLESRDNYAGYFTGARLVGMAMAFGVEYLAFENTGDSIEHAEQIVNIQFASKVFDFLSWGFGQEYVTVEDRRGKRDLSSVTIGASSNIADFIYLGFAIGHDAVKENRPTGNLFYDRDFRMYGAALRTSGDYRLYLDLSLLDKDDFDHPFGNDGGYAATTGTLQLSAWNIVASAAYTEIALKKDFDRQGNNAVTVSTRELGFVPAEGISIFVRQEILTDRNASKSRDVRGETWSATLAYQF